jgi:hypothetical protein
MPILDLQMRMRQLGEIRIGHAIDTGRLDKNGKAVKRPAKLNAFRFTSPSREILTSVATLYGGEVKPWTPANGGPSEFEVYSTSTRLPVLIPPRDSVSQWYELYAGSKCQRRCDGVTEHKQDRPCMCNPEERDCKITTRVNVMLRNLPALGQWLLISKGYHAAVTLPPAAELLAKAGGYVEGWLGMEEKSAIVKDKPARFMVPTLDVEITPTALMAGNITGATPAVATGPERVAIAAAPAAQSPAAGPPRDYLAEAQKAKTQEEVLALFQEAKNAGAPLEYQEQLKAIGQNKPTAPVTPPAVPDADGAIDAEVLDDPSDIQDAWFRIVAAAGSHGMTTEQVESEFAQQYGGLHPSSASVAQLTAFLAVLKGGQA